MPIDETSAAFENPGGMWVPRQLGAHHSEQLGKLGLEVDAAALSNPTAHPLGAVVSLGGCSASFVSGDGLIVTNHHCVTGSLQYNSTPKDNLVDNGFLAKTRADEKWNGPTARVYVTQAFTDVTDRVRRGIDQIADAKKRHDEVESRTKALVAECEKAKPNVRCQVAGYFGGAEYLLIERLEIKDVRLVYAPAKGVGNFGGEIDNWMWPRHTGDFGFYRAYVGKDGKPADHDKSNVPYKPPHHLKLASKPLRAGDLVFVAGYPGRTHRLKTADEVTEAVEWWYPKRIELCNDYLELLNAIGKDDEAVKLKATPLHRGLSNVLKYTRGAVEGLTQGGAAKQKRSAEATLRAWVDADAKRKAKYGDVFAKLEALFAERKKTRDGDRALWELGRMSDLVTSANTIVRMAEERAKKDADRDPRYQKRNWQRLEQAERRMQKSYAQKLDRALLTLAVERTAALPKEVRPEMLRAITGSLEPGKADIAKKVAALYAKTKLENVEHRVKLLKSATSAQLKKSRDPFIRLAVTIRPMLQAQEDREDAYTGAMLVERPRYIAALREMPGGAVAPDANGTLRVTYGTVRGYTPRTGAKPYTPFTVLSEVAGKATGKAPFDAPEKLLAAEKAGKVGPYVDSELGEVPVNFLADLDITGGNSGSATLNSRGELVGLAFDGNYEAMASDWLFMPSITRSIHVDIRYALWVMDAVDGADRLIEEMGGTPAIE